MSMREQKILIEAGYTLLRCDLINKRIWKCSKPGGWTILSKHKTQAETSRAWSERMKDETNLAG